LITNILEHEFLVPVVLGNDSVAVKTALRIKKATYVKVHLFAERFPLWQRLLFSCHEVQPYKDCFFEDSLNRFALSLDEYMYPVIISHGKKTDEFINCYSETLEAAFVAVRSDRLTDLYSNMQI